MPHLLSQDTSAVLGAEKHRVGLPTHLCKPHVLQGLGYYGYIKQMMTTCQAPL